MESVKANVPKNGDEVTFQVGRGKRIMVRAVRSVERDFPSPTVEGSPQPQKYAYYSKEPQMGLTYYLDRDYKVHPTASKETT